MFNRLLVSSFRSASASSSSFSKFLSPRIWSPSSSLFFSSSGAGGILSVKDLEPSAHNAHFSELLDTSVDLGHFDGEFGFRWDLPAFKFIPSIQNFNLTEQDLKKLEEHRAKQGDALQYNDKLGLIALSNKTQEVVDILKEMKDKNVAQSRDTVLLLEAHYLFNGLLTPEREIAFQSLKQKMGIKPVALYAMAD